MNGNTNDKIAVEMRWILLCSAAKSLKPDSLLKPFPPMFIDEHGEKNFDKLVSIFCTSENKLLGSSKSKISLRNYLLFRMKPWTTLDDFR